MTTTHPAAELTPAARRRLFAVASVGAFASSLSASIVGAVLPRIGAWSGTDMVEVQWVMLTPLVVISSVLLPAGRAGDLFGNRRVYLAGLGFLFLGSVLSALAGTFAMFLGGRAVQGFGSALVMAAAPALVSLGAGPGRRGRALGMVSTALYFGLTLGPPLGGLLETWGTFRAVFWAQAGLAAALFLVAAAFLPEVARPTVARRLDLAGTALLAASLALLLLAGTRWHVWPGGLLAAAGAGGAALLLAFLAWELRTPGPVLDLRLFLDRTFASAAVGATLNYLAVSHVNFLMPFHLEEGLGMSPRQAGLWLTAMPLVMALVAGPSGALSDRLGSRGLSSLGMAISCLALAGLGLAVHRGTMVPLVGGLAVMGLGTGLFVSPNTNALLSAAPRERQGTASGVMALARNLGMVAGTAMAAGVYTVARAPGAAAAAEVRGLTVALGLAATLAAAGALVVLVRPTR